MKTFPEIQAHDFHKKQVTSVVMNFGSIPWTISFHIGFVCDKNTRVFEKKNLTQFLFKRKICFSFALILFKILYFILIPFLNVLIFVGKLFARSQGMRTTFSD